MKNFIRIISIVTASVLFIMLLASCGNTSSNPEITLPSATTTTTAAKPTTYTVSFSGADKPPVTVTGGDFISAPTSPEKAEHIFVGWYLDSAFGKKASFPLEINGNTTLYAKFYTYAEAFQSARENTVGASVAGYEYNYKTDLTVSYGVLALKGATTGESIYSTVGDVSFYDKHQNSGALFADGTVYQIRKGNTLQKVSTDKKGNVKSNETEQVDASYKFDSSSFAKALFTYSDGQLVSVSPTANKNEYRLQTTFNASSAIALLGNNLNNPMVEKAIAKLPETAVDTGMYVVFDGEKIGSYRYEMKINSAGIQLNLVYTLTFENVGTAQTIVPESFS